MQGMFLAIRKIVHCVEWPLCESITLVSSSHRPLQAGHLETKICSKFLICQFFENNVLFETPCSVYVCACNFRSNIET